MQSGDCELASGARSHALKCTLGPPQLCQQSTEKLRLQHRVSSFSAQVDITPLYLYIDNSCLLLY